ncbi:MAG TPA: patatin-like phospholipase family protein [Candidatus Dormibacteraeota bacterium]|nr:patatin-like phospholipase family protein [Candidatus Dormibacteraeota bacterium]
MDGRVGLGPWLDIFRVRGYFDAITQLRDVARQAKEDATFIGSVRRSVLKLPFEHPQDDGLPLWTGRPRRRALRRARLGIVATGGSGALASLVGVVKACEELGVEPAAMSFASGAALFAYPIAAGKTPDQVAEFVLELDPTDWVDPDWAGVATIVPKLGRGFSGIIRGERVEKVYREFLGGVTLGDLRIPTYLPAWNVERNQLEYLNAATYPDLEVAKAVRIAVSLPLFFEPVAWRGGSWCDGAVVDIFPVTPLLDEEKPFDAVLAVNCFYPPEFRGEDATGWKSRTWSVVDLADQVMSSQHLQLAREHLRRLRNEVGTVLMIEPVPYTVVRRTGLYEQFIDRSGWRDFMRSGRRQAAAALSSHLATRPRPRHASTAARR